MFIASTLQSIFTCIELALDYLNAKHDVKTFHNTADHCLFWYVAINVMGLLSVIYLCGMNGSTIPQASVGIFAIVLMAVSSYSYYLHKKYGRSSNY